MHIRRGDTVVALSGRNAAAGKTGKVMQAMPARGMVIVEGFNLVKKAQRPTQDNPKGGIGQKELPMPAGKLQLYCPACKKGVRVARIAEAGKRIRKCRKCGHAFDG